MTVKTGSVMTSGRGFNDLKFFHMCYISTCNCILSEDQTHSGKEYVVITSCTQGGEATERNFCIRSQSPIFHCHTTFWPFSWFEQRFGLMTGDEFYGQRYLRAFNDNVIGWELCNLHSTTQLQDRILLNITQLQSQLYYRHFITNYHVMISDPTGQEYKPSMGQNDKPSWVKMISPHGSRV